jgi:hypothetical protein
MNFLRLFVFTRWMCIGPLLLAPLIVATQPSAKASTVSLLVVGDMMLAGAPGKEMQARP